MKTLAEYTAEDYRRDRLISEICDAVSVIDGRPTIAEMWALTMAELRELHDTLVDDAKGTVPA